MQITVFLRRGVLWQCALHQSGCLDTHKFILNKMWLDDDFSSRNMHWLRLSRHCQNPPKKPTCSCIFSVLAKTTCCWKKQTVSMTTLQWWQCHFTVRGNADPHTKCTPESYITPFYIISVQVLRQGEITQSVPFPEALLFWTSFVLFVANFLSAFSFP